MKTSREILKEVVEKRQGKLSGLIWDSSYFEAAEQYGNQFKEQRNLLNEKISALLIAIEKGYVTVYPENELTPDYIQDLEDAQIKITKQNVFNRA